MNGYLTIFWTMLVEMSPFVIIGMLAAGFLHEALGRFRTLRNFARKRSILSLSFFNLAGFALPICSCGTVPIAVGLRRQNVPFGNIFSFIFSAPASSVAAVILSLAMLGPAFTFYYVAGAVICGYAIGVLFYVTDRRWSSETVAGIPVYLADDSSDSQRANGFCMRAVRWGTVTYGSRISFDLILGLSLAALLTSTYSVQTLGQWISGFSYWLAAPVMIAIALPLYICSLPGLMVGATLILGEVPPELVWVFLMAGPVTNLGDINVLRHNLGWGNTCLYVGAVVIVTLLWGWVMHTKLDWMDVWAHVRDYYAAQRGIINADGEIAGALAQSPWPSIPRSVYSVSAVILAVFTINGAWLTIREFWTNPCLHCKHFQMDMSLTPALCNRPCWKKRVLRTIKKLPFLARKKAGRIPLGDLGVSEERRTTRN